MLNIIKVLPKLNSKTTQLLTKVPKFANYRNVSTTAINKTDSQQKITYTTVYKFPYIRPFSVLNRLKFYQTVLTGIAVPTSCMLNQLNFISTGAFQVICSLGLSGCLTLYGLGYLTIKFIGFIYYNEQNNLVKISYVDFWGWRKDIEISAKDVVPINELPTSATDGLFLKIRRYSTKEILKLNFQYGIIVEKELIKKIL
ncbi:unnamed protein product [Psylliodes chrysocephalus]|uniref:Transmembrane protein 186 n=1 Tax=Psylliodes chrysocephalus TaxID=3402493 RepID=A0A9P0D3Z2_9CUCU|nr:unnamed protein product [Psylliodes chrysocephala]